MFFRRGVKIKKLTVITTFGGTSEFNINKIDLELLGGLDTNQERRTTTGSNNLVREVFALEDESKGTFLLLTERRFLVHTRSSSVEGQ